MLNTQLPQNKTLSEQVSDLIEKQIINGTLSVGDKLPTEIELAEMFKVSRTVIREATKILKEKGRLESHAGRGTFVVDRTDRVLQVSLNAIVQMNPEAGFDYLLEVREIIEPEMAAIAAARATEEQIIAMQEVIDLMDNSLEGKASFDEMVDADHKFHNLLAEATGNPLITLLTKPIASLMHDQQQFMTYQVVNGPQKSQRYHKLILEAIKKHDPVLARKMMHEHIHQIYVDIHNQESPETKH